MTPDEFRRNGHDLIDWIADYLDGVGDRPVQATVAPGDVRAALPEHPPTEPESFEAVMADVDRVIMPGVTNWQHPNWFAYFPANNSYAVDPRRVAVGGLGVQGMSWVTSPACTELETLMLDWMQELLDLSEVFRSTSDTGGGVIQGSASEATLVAILSARFRATRRSDQRRRRHLEAGRVRDRRSRTRASRRVCASPASAPIACGSFPTTTHSPCAPMRWPR